MEKTISLKTEDITSQIAIRGMIDKYLPIFNEVHSWYPNHSIVDLLHASNCRVNDLSEFDRLDKTCESMNKCPYQKNYDGERLCHAEYLLNGYKV